jgi:Flp pilus assembly pilin Flp
MIKRYQLLALTLCLLGGIHSNAQSWTQVGADIDGEAAGDYSGYSVSLSSDGSTVAIGALYNDGNGSNAGHVRIYKNTNGSWTQVGADIDGEAAGDRSGISVSLSSDGSVVAIGAPGNDGSGSEAGHVRIYKNISGTWTQVGADIDGEAAGDYSGKSISLSSDGSTVAIGAHYNDGSNGSASGHVRIYKNVSGSWTQVGADIDGEAAADLSGSSVSLSGDGSTVAIGAHWNDGNGSSAGHVRIYENINSTWTQVGGDIDGEATYDYSGISVSLSSDASTVAIGAYANNGNGTDAGHVRIYKNTNGTWTQVDTDIDGEAAYDWFGWSVSLNNDGSTVAIGAFFNDGNGSQSGHVRIYKNISGTWTQIGSDIDGEAAYDYSGYSIALSSDASTVAIGAYLNDGNGTSSGHVRVYNICSTTFSTDTITSCGPYTWIDGVTYSTSNYTATDTLTSATGCDSIVTLHLTIPNALTGNWTQVGSDIDGEAAGDRSGYSVSISSDGSTVAIGAIFNNGNGINAGHVRIYKNISSTWTQIGADIDGEAAGDYSGFSVSLSSDGSSVAIGAWVNDGNGSGSGHVRIYKNISGSWAQVGADIDGEAAYDASGYSVSLSSDGSSVAIGARANDGNGINAGHVRIYKNISGTWTQQGADIDGEAAYDFSGESVSLSSDGNTVAIAAFGNDGNGSDAGHVRIYKNISGTWTQQGADIDGEAAGDASGSSVSLSSDGSTVAIGATGNDGNGSYSGHVRIYKNISGTWTQVGADIDGEAANDGSGVSVSLSSDGSTVAIGANGNNGNGSIAGHVRVYKNISGTWTQVGADIDGEAAYDFSGYSIALSSDASTVAIGAYLNDGNGSNAGHVRVYNLESVTYPTDTITSCGPYTWIDGVTYTTSNYTATDTLLSAAGCDSVIVSLHLTIPNALTGNWTQVGSDIDGEAAGDLSGNSVALSSDGNTVAIGARLNDGNGTNSGHVRVFRKISGNWSQIGADIDGEVSADWSGHSVSLSSDGSTVAIGADSNNGNGTNAGHVRVYKNINGTWTQVGVDIDGEAIGDRSGWSVSLSNDGSTVAIGAIYNDGSSTNAGHVRIYKNINGTWTQVGADIDGEGIGDRSGWSVSLSSDGSVVAIGAPNNDDDGTNAGHVRIYKNISGTWTQVGSDIDGEAADDYSGSSVSLSSDGSIVAIGARGNDGNGIDAGHVRVYKNINSSWTQIGTDIDGEAANDQSGWTVSLSSDGSTVAIGAYPNDGNGTDAGHVRIYKNTNGTWTQVDTDIDGEAAGDESGWSVSLSSDGSTVAIGAPHNDGNGTSSGHVRVYNIESVTYSTDTITSCGPYTWIDGVTYSTSNYTATDTLLSAAGCDSAIVTLHLSINSSNTGTDTITACDSYTWIDGNTYTASNNTATYTLTNAAGCDSVVTLDLTINSSNTGTDVITACDSYTWIDGNTYTASNNSATYVLNNVNGCDSVVTLDLTIESIDASVTLSGLTIYALPGYDFYQWYECTSNGFVLMSNETNDSISITVNGDYAVMIDNNNCSDTSDCVTVNNIGLRENTQASFKLFPNPTQGMVKIERNNSVSPIDIYQLQLVDSHGKLIQNSPVNFQDEFIVINIEDYPAGVYQLTLKNQHEVFHEKISKVH